MCIYIYIYTTESSKDKVETTASKLLTGCHKYIHSVLLGAFMAKSTELTVKCYYSHTDTQTSLFHTKFFSPPSFWCTLSFTGADKSSRSWRCEWIPRSLDKSSGVDRLFEQPVKFVPHIRRQHKSANNCPTVRRHLSKVWASYVTWPKFAHIWSIRL